MTSITDTAVVVEAADRESRRGKESLAKPQTRLGINRCSWPVALEYEVRHTRLDV